MADELREVLGFFMGEDTTVSTHWQGCWKVHHACAVALLERILASDNWAAECAELGCTDDDHSSRTVAPKEG